ncbi:Modular serine protease [Sergentomyia squamirostris]
MALKWLCVIIFLLIELSNHTNGFTFSTSRLKRENRCGEFDWVCDDESCIDDILRCDGKADCPDGSDETGSCRHIKCPKYAFQCAYGACVDGSAQCNGVKDCVDNSDELTIKCDGVLEFLRDRGNCSEGYRQCRSGECVFEDELCNGKQDCVDASDESLARCFNFYCPPYAFRCDYGACISGDAKCDDKYDCFDGSDETEKLCGKPPPPKETTPKPIHITPTESPVEGNCKAPIFTTGRMFVMNNVEIFPGHIIQNGQDVTFTCSKSRIIGDSVVFCINGQLLPMVPKCSRSCSNVPLNTLTVQATCQTSEGDSIPCSSQLSPGTVADIKCKHGYSMPKEFVQTRTRCEDDGSWSNHVFKCDQICGIIEEGHAYVSGGRETNITQVPWQAAIYELRNGRYIQICGGSVLTATAIVSAAHCFWDPQRNKVREPDFYSVAVGKSYRDYYNQESGMQINNVSLIETFPQYNDYDGLYSGDVAVLVLKSPIIFKPYIKPVCLPPALEGNDKYIPSNWVGRVAGWGLTENGVYSSVLKVLDLQTVDFRTCRDRSSDSFKNFITYDKFCAGNPDNSNVCEGDSGGGFMLPTTQTVNGRSRKVYYLRGIVSVGANKGEECVANHFTAFTDVQHVFRIFNKYLP